MKQRHLLSIVAVLAIVSGLLLGCGGQPTPVTESPTAVVENTVAPTTEAAVAPTTPAVERIEELQVAQFANPAELSCPNWGTQDTLDVMQHFAEPLFRFDRDRNIQGVLVESWEDDGPTTWTLHIRKGVKFQDSQYGELTAEDVVASLEWCFSPEAPMVTVHPGLIAEMELAIVDDYTVEIKIPEPGLAGLPNSLGLTAITSKKYLEQVGAEWTLKPMGTGPYKFVEWEPNVRIVGERFEGYWGQDPGVERIVWRIIPDAFTRKSEFLTGAIDVLPFMMADWVPEVEANAGVRVEPTLSSRMIMIVLPVKQEPYSDIRVRKALNYAVNKEEIVAQLFQGIGALPLTGVIHPIVSEADPNRVGYPFDPEKAKQLLEEARADGVEIGTLTLYAPNDRYNLDKEMGEAVAGYWRAVGLDVEYMPESRTTLFPRVQALEMKDPFLFGIGDPELRAESAPSVWLQTRTDPPSRGSEYAVGLPEWDGMIEELTSLPSGSEESIRVAREIDGIWTDYAPWVFLINYVDLYGVSNQIDWKPYPGELRIFVDVRPAD